MVKQPKAHHQKKLLSVIILCLSLCSCVSKKHVSDVEVSRHVNTNTKAYEQKVKTDSNEEYTEIEVFGDTSILAKMVPGYIDVIQKNTVTKNKKNKVANTLKQLATIKITTISNKKTITESKENTQKDSIYKKQEKSNQHDMENKFKRFGSNFPGNIIIFSLIIFLCLPNLSSLFKKILAFLKKIK